MSDLNTEIKLTASADGVETGVARAKRSLADLGATAAKTGSEGGKGLEGIGAGGEAAARKVDAATRSMQNSLQRQIAALEAGGTATRQYQESLAKLRGVDASALKPLLDQLDAARAKADGAGQGFLGLGSASSLLQGQLAALAGSLTLGSMAAFVLQINNGIDALNDIKDATGSTIENISALEDVGKRTGASLDLVGSILIKFNDVLSKAGPKSDIALQLQAIGLSAEELKRLDPAEALLRTAQALQKYADDGNKARLVQDLFGKSVKDAAPFLNDLAAKGELVAKVTSQQAEEAEKFNKELFALQANIQEASRRLAGPMVTAINEVAEAFRKGSAQGKGFWENASDRYWSNVRGFYGGNTPAAGGSVGSVGSGDTALARATAGAAGDDRPSVVLGPTAAEIAAAETAARAAAQRATAARERELAEQAKFYADLSGLSADYYDKLARAQQERAAGNISEAQYVEYVEQLIQKQPFATALTRDNAAALKAQTAAVLEAAKASAAYYSAIGQDLTRLDDQNERLRQEGQQIGLTAEGLLALTLARQDHAIAMEAERLTLLQANEGSTAEILLQQRRIELLKEQRTLTASNGQRQIATDAAKDAAKEWERTSQQIEQSLTDALMRGFESGKGFAEVLRDTVVNMFKTLVLRPVIQATVQGGLNAVGLGGPAGQGGGLLGTVNTASNLYSAFGNGAGAAAGTLAASNVVGAAGGDALGTLIAGNAGNWGVSAAGVSGGASIMGSVAAAAPYLAAVLAVVSLAKALDDSGTPHTGGYGSYSAASGATMGAALRDAPGSPFGLSDDAITRAGNDAAVAMAQAVVGLLDSTANAFGQNAGYAAATAFADDTSKDGAWGALSIKLGDKMLLNWADTQTSRWAPKEFANGEEGAKQYAAAVALDVRTLLIEQTPDWADAMLTALGDAPTIEALAATVGQINAAASAMDSMGKASQAFAAMGEEAAGALIKALGGAEAAVAGLSGYYSGFYTEAERTKLATDEVTAALAKIGVAMPTTRDAFRGIVDAAIAAGDTDLAAKLISISGAFAAVVPAAEAAAKAVEDNAKATAKAAADSAFSGLQRAVDAQRTVYQAQIDAAQEAAGSLQGVFDLLAGNIRDLYAEAAGPSLTAYFGNKIINDALSAARTTGYMPEQGTLSDAIAAARGGLGMEQYASVAEQQYAQKELANRLLELQGLTGEQLTAAEIAQRTAESQLEALDATLEYWKQQIDLSQGNITATLSVADAITALQDAIKPGSTPAGKAAADAKSAAADGSGGFSSGPGKPYTGPGSNSGFYEASVGYYDGLAAIGDYYSSMSGWDNPQQQLDNIMALYNQADLMNVSVDQLSAGIGIPADDIQQVLADLGLPPLRELAVGTNYVPRDGVAYLHEGEAVVPKAYNPAAGGAAPAQVDTRRMEQLLADVAARLAAIEATSRQHAAQFDQVTEGGNAIRSTAIA